MIVTLEFLGNHDTVRLAFNANSDMRPSGIIWSDAVATSEGRARIAVPNLPDGDYYYAAEVDGKFRRDTAGKIRITSSPSYRFAICGDRLTFTATNTLDVVRGTDPDFVMWIGDMHYSNNTTNTEAAVKETFKRARSCRDLHMLLSQCNVPYIWDDHDYGPGDSDNTAPAKLSARKVFRKMVPVTLADDTADAPVYYTFQRGRVLFIVTDLRSTRDPKTKTDNVNKVMLGASQKAWFESVLSDADNDDKVFIWVNSLPWIADSSSSDTWGGYQTERTELANYIKQHAEGRIAIISTDQHAIAYDDGTHSDYATGGGAAMPVCHAAPINQENTGKGGPYLIGPLTDHNGQWGEITVSDNGGSAIDFNFKAYWNNGGTPTKLVDETFSLSL